MEPRVVAGLDENRLIGYTWLPLNHNPYLDEFRAPRARRGRALARAQARTTSSSTVRPRAGAGSLRFRFWVTT